MISKGTKRIAKKPGHNFTLNATFDDVKAEAYDALVIPGGRAPEYIRLNEKVLGIVQDFAKADKPIAAICHAAQLLAAAGVLEGKSCSAYPAVGPDVNLAGGKYVDIAVHQAHVDGKTCNRPGMACASRLAGKVPRGPRDQNSALILAGLQAMLTVRNRRDCDSVEFFHARTITQQRAFVS